MIGENRAVSFTIEIGGFCGQPLQSYFYRSLKFSLMLLEAIVRIGILFYLGHLNFDEGLVSVVKHGLGL